MIVYPFRSNGRNTNAEPVILTGYIQSAKKMCIRDRASVDQSKISYVSVLIHSSDTLSSIANEYYCDAFGSVQDYAEAIQEYNSLDSDLIYAGNHLMVPVYQAN